SLRVSLRQVTAEELDGASVRELLSLGVVLGPITLHEPVLRPRMDVRLLTLRFGGRRDELVVLGEVALVRHAVRRVVHVAVDRHERGNVFALLGYLPRIPPAEAERDDPGAVTVHVGTREQLVERRRDD